jgi:hypothetical protein
MQTAERLRELISYDATTGVLQWRVSRRGRSTRAGKVAGTVRDGGYVQIRVDGGMYRRSRLVWYISTAAGPQMKLIT